MIFESLVIILFILILIRSILSAIRDQKLIELNAQLLARQKQPKPKQKRYEFIEDAEPYIMAANEEEESETIWM